jgi:hypothetical protein
MRAVIEIYAAVAALALGLYAPAAAAQCQPYAEMEAKFLELYPTGGEASRHAGEQGQAVMEMLLFSGHGDEVAFLYSGDGPTTGARGRYMYMILDENDCILKHGWLDGKIYDRLTSGN